MHCSQSTPVVPTRSRHTFTDQFTVIGVKDDAFYLGPAEIDANTHTPYIRPCLTR